MNFVRKLQQCKITVYDYYFSQTPDRTQEKYSAGVSFIKISDLESNIYILYV